MKFNLKVISPAPPPPHQAQSRTRADRWVPPFWPESARLVSGCRQAGEGETKKNPEFFPRTERNWKVRILLYISVQLACTCQFDFRPLRSSMGGVVFVCALSGGGGKGWRKVVTFAKLVTQSWWTQIAVQCCVVLVIFETKIGFKSES